MFSILDSLNTAHRRYLTTVQMAGVMEYRPHSDEVVKQLVDLKLLAMSFDAKGSARVRLTHHGDMIATQLIRGEGGSPSTN
jgi:hypothetical protein